MTLTREQETVLGTLFELGKGTITSPVTISALHGTFSDMDVRDLVEHLGVLIDRGFIENAGKPTGRIGNTYVLTPNGGDYYNQTIGKLP
jgi:DNA-binding MarR family transcriptional regulator